MPIPKIVWPSGGANVLRFAFPPVGVRPFDIDAQRHDTVMSGGKRQSLLERTDEFLELDITLVPTEVDNYFIWTEQFDVASWAKAQIGLPGVPVVTADQVANPLNEEITADQIDFPVTAGGEESFITQNAFALIPVVPDREFAYTIWLRAASALTIRIMLNDNISSSFKDVVLAVDWQRFIITQLADSAATAMRGYIRQIVSQPAKTLFAFGAQLSYGLNAVRYAKTEGVIPAAIDRWVTFITAVRDGTNFDYYPDAFTGGFTTYVLEDKKWQPKLQVRGRNRFYEFQLKLRKFV